MQYNNFRTRAITVSEANRILEVIKSYGIPILYLGLNEPYEGAKIKIDDFNYSRYAIVKENDTNIFIETRYYEWAYKPTRYVCWLDNKKRTTLSGLQAFYECQRWCYKAVHASKYGNSQIDSYWDPELRKYACSASPLIGYNPKYEMQELHDVYEYDINSAYSSIMLQEIPDLNNPHYNCEIKKGQVGFFLDQKLTMIEYTPGAYVEVAFDLIKLNDAQKGYIRRIYRDKQFAQTDEDYAQAKLKMNAAIGYYQKYNPFMRSFIVNRCNAVIKRFIDENTIMWNTDAIFSLKPRPELKLGNDIGDFKEVRIKRFVYKGNNYQIDHEKPKYRGVASSWFPDGWDMFKDPLPKRDNDYVYDRESHKIKVNKDHWK